MASSPGRKTLILDSQPSIWGAMAIAQFHSMYGSNVPVKTIDLGTLHRIRHLIIGSFVRGGKGLWHTGNRLAKLFNKTR